MTPLLAIEAQGLGKTYTRVKKQPGLLGAFKALFSAERSLVEAVKGLDLKVKAGETLGLIGENGAGKSTTVKLLTGILHPSAGHVRVLGLEPFRQRRLLAKRMGVVFGQRPQLLWDIAVRETFGLLKEMYEIPPAVFEETSKTTRRLLDLDALLDIPVRQLSLGQRMRCDLAAAVLHGPAIAFLDEPTIGLDVVAKEQARELIRWLCRRFGTALILTTHDLKDITETCERVVLLDRGRLLFDGSLTSFERRYAREKRLVADFEPALNPGRRRALEARLKRLGVKRLAWAGPRLTVAAERQASLTAATRTVLATGSVADLNFEKTEIEKVVRDIYAAKDR